VSLWTANFLWWRNRSAPGDGTACGNEMAHNWFYVHEQCMGRVDLQCRNCGIPGMLEPGRDEDRFEWPSGRLFRSVYHEVHYTDGAGTCRFCRIKGEST
jgi:hypothetical protein